AYPLRVPHHRRADVIDHVELQALLSQAVDATLRRWPPALGEGREQALLCRAIAEGRAFDEGLSEGALLINLQVELDVAAEKLHPLRAGLHARLHVGQGSFEGLDDLLLVQRSDLRGNVRQVARAPTRRVVLRRVIWGLDRCLTTPAPAKERRGQREGSCNSDGVSHGLPRCSCE